METNIIMYMIADNKILIERIKRECFTKTNKINTAVIRREWFKTSELYNHIMNATQFLSNDAKVAERINGIINGLTAIPKCICGKQLKYTPQNQGYRASCSLSCSYLTNPPQNRKKSTIKQNILNDMNIYNLKHNQK